MWHGSLEQCWTVSEVNTKAEETLNISHYISTGHADAHFICQDRQDDAIVRADTKGNKLTTVFSMKEV